MKYLLGVIFISSLSFADTPGRVCSVQTVTVCEGQKVVVVSKKRGKNKIKKTAVVEKQPIKKEEKIIRSEVKVETKMPKNQLILGLRHDIVSLSAKSERVGLVQKASVQAEEGAVLSLKYIRNGILSDNVGIGLGVDTNGVVEGLVGWGF